MITTAWMLVGCPSPEVAPEGPGAAVVTLENGYGSGVVVSALGDVNHDGIDDIALGVDGNRAVSILTGREAWPERLDVERDAHAMLTGAAGEAVAGVGDINGDGSADLLIGERAHDGYRGRAWLIWGLNRLTGAKELDDRASEVLQLLGESEDDHAGGTVFGPGDVDGGGTVDLLVGAWGKRVDEREVGAVYLVSGESLRGDTFELRDASTVWIGSEGLGGSTLGTQLGRGGDLDADGLPDYLFASADVVYAGLSTQHASGTFDASDAGAQWAAHASAGVGDVDGDGVDDVLLGDHELDWERGAVWLLLGGESLLRGPPQAPADQASAELWGADEGDRAGCNLRGAGDVDGDGRADVLIGAYGDQTHGTFAGTTYLVLGADISSGASSGLEEIAASIHRGQVTGTYLGLELDGGLDADGDGLSDYLIGNRRDGGNAWLVLDAQ